MYALNQEFQRSLLGQPESGMGFQRVRAQTLGYETKSGLVFNATLLVLDEQWDAALRQLRLEGFGTILTLARPAEAEFRTIEVQRPVSQSLREPRPADAQGPASAAPLESTKSGAEFNRFSAFERDLRITPDRGLLPGTYATTRSDGALVKTGADAVLRYALPNDDPASNRFLISPVADTLVRTGIVQRAFGKPGGGIEVIFVKGSRPATVTLPPHRLPDR